MSPLDGQTYEHSGVCNCTLVVVSGVVQFRTRNIGQGGGITKIKCQVKIVGTLRETECLLEPGSKKRGGEGSSRPLQHVLNAKELSVYKHF